MRATMSPWPRTGGGPWKSSAAWCPDLIISDVLMPEMGGFELFKKVQDEDHLQHLPFIFLTALD
jgi:CheY-like chemotaxis protein